MSVSWRDIGPVIVSMGIIIAVAIIRSQSRTAAAVLATMPINVPLALWVVYAGAGGDKAAMVPFTQSLLMGILPTVCFIFVVWMAARAGWRLAPMLVAGYVVWGLGLGATLLLRRLVAA